MATVPPITPPHAKRKAETIDIDYSPKRHCSSAQNPRNLCSAQFSDNSTAGLRKTRAYSVDPPRLHSSSPCSLHLQRSRSLDHCPTLPRLTQENLRLFDDPFPSFSMSLPRNPSPTRRDTAIANKRQLAGYNITVDQGSELPDVLAQFVRSLRQTRNQEPSPHAQAIADIRRAASVENEITARKMMEEHILFRGEGYPTGVKYVTLKDQVNLVKDYLPEPPRVTVQELWGSLARPQPDSCIGYITATEARSHTPALAMPFTRLENDVADWYVAKFKQSFGCYSAHSP